MAYVFLSDGEREAEEITYLQLDQQARRIGAWLQVCEPGSEAVGLLYQPGLSFIEAFFGCLYAGLVAIPLQTPPGLKRLEGLSAILRDAGTSLVLTRSDILETLQKGATTCEWARPLRWLATDHLTGDQDPSWHHPDRSVDSAAFYQYTSGTTGAPRGVVVSHANVLANEELIRQAFQHDQSTMGMGWLPHFHDMGLIGNILQMLYIGRPCILMSPFHFIQRPFRWLQAISHYRATSSGGPNFAYELCVQKIRDDQREQLDLSSWTLAFTGAETVRWDTIRRFSDRFAGCGFNPQAFYPCYGLAEATLFVTGIRDRRPIVVKTVSRPDLMVNRVVPSTAPSDQSLTIVGCGREGLHHQVLIVDPLNRARCPADRVGEIWVQGASVARGYRNRGLETEQTFSATLADSGMGPFLRTGDLGFIQDDNLFITGRIKDIIILQGKTLYPHEIELTVERCFSGLQSGGGAAFSLEGEGSEQVVVVQEIEGKALRSIHLIQCTETIRRRVLSVHGVRVQAVVLIRPATIPRTTSGKVRRADCRSEFLSGSLAVVHSWILPSAQSERVAVSADLLGLGE
ncbi:fatty acyl-AMP ligase [Cyanobium sp. ATX 6F1]|nr:fatty acyl-AMP ligase [Cyanobium sp. ATX 6F1]